jgi:hypothetical protein
MASVCRSPSVRLLLWASPSEQGSPSLMPSPSRWPLAKEQRCGWGEGWAAQSAYESALAWHWAYALGWVWALLSRCEGVLGWAQPCWYVLQWV